MSSLDVESVSSPEAESVSAPEVEPPVELDSADPSLSLGSSVVGPLGLSVVTSSSHAVVLIARATHAHPKNPHRTLSPKKAMNSR